LKNYHFAGIIANYNGIIKKRRQAGKRKTTKPSKEGKKPNQKIKSGPIPGAPAAHA
jgi:hypothetical protein